MWHISIYLPYIIDLIQMNYTLSSQLIRYFKRHFPHFQLYKSGFCWVKRPFKFIRFKYLNKYRSYYYQLCYWLLRPIGFRGSSNYLPVLLDILIINASLSETVSLNSMSFLLYSVIIFTTGTMSIITDIKLHFIL